MTRRRFAGTCALWVALWLRAVVQVVLMSL